MPTMKVGEVGVHGKRREETEIHHAPEHLTTQSRRITRVRHTSTLCPNAQGANPEQLQRQQQCYIAEEPFDAPEE